MLVVRAPVCLWSGLWLARTRGRANHQERFHLSPVFCQVLRVLSHGVRRYRSCVVMVRLREQLAARVSALPPRPSPAEPRLLPRGARRQMPPMFSELPAAKAPAPSSAQAPPPAEERRRQLKQQRHEAQQAQLDPETESAWRKFLRTHAEEPDVLAAIEAETTKMQEEVEHEQSVQLRQQQQTRARERWRLVREHVHAMGKTRWYRIIDRAALEQRRQERERQRRQRDADEAAAVTEAVQASAAARRDADDQARRKAAVEEWRRRASAAQVVLKKLVAERKQRERNAERRASIAVLATPARQRRVVERVVERPAATIAVGFELRSDSRKRVPRLQVESFKPIKQQPSQTRTSSTRSSPTRAIMSPLPTSPTTPREVTVPLQSESLNRLAAAKQEPSGYTDTSSWLQKMPDFVPWNALPPMDPEARKKLVDTIRTSDVGHEATISGSFVNPVAIRPRTSGSPTKRAMPASKSAGELHAWHGRSLLPNQPRRAARHEATGSRASAAALVSEAAIKDSWPNAPSPVTRSPSSLMRVKGAVPFQSPGLLAPLQHLAHSNHVRDPSHHGLGDCAHHLVATMEGGEPRALPVSDRLDLRAVLLQAGVDVELWPQGALNTMLAELSSLEAVLMSRSNRTSTMVRMAYDATPPCPHLLLKRRVLYLHLLSDCERYELVQRAADEQQEVEYERLSARLTDRTSPASYATAVVAEALEVPEDAIMHLDAQPVVAQSDAMPSCYPGVLCEHTFYVLRLCVQGLPTHSFRKHRTDWVWRPAAVGRIMTRQRNSPRRADGSPTCIGL